MGKENVQVRVCGMCADHVCVSAQEYEIKCVWVKVRERARENCFDIVEKRII